MSVKYLGFTENGEAYMASDLRDDYPSEIGWYAVLQCWDAEEGIFPGAYYWNGERWTLQNGHEGLRLPSIRYWPVVFDSQEAAEAYAYARDPDFK